MRGYIKAAMAALLCVCLCACVSCELLRVSGFFVVSWTPGEGRFGNDDDTGVRVTFSEPPDRVSAENAFSMTEGGSTVAGAFSWEGATLSFTPYVAVRENASFRISVSSEAMNPRGVSLEPELEGRFTTRAEDIRPAVLSTSPERGATIPDGPGAVSITFTEALDPATYRDCLSVSPYAPGSWLLSADGATARFTPLAPWTHATDYSVTVSAGLMDACGNRSGEGYSFWFSVGEDGSAPTLLEAAAVDPLGELRAILAADYPDDGSITENAGWEGPWRLRLSFSEPVALDSLASRTAREDGAGMTLETSGPTADRVTFRFDERPAWGRRFSVLCGDGIEDTSGNATESDIVLRFVADGPGSRPPRLVGIRVPLAPGATLAQDRDLAAFGVDHPFSTLAIAGDEARYPIGVATATSIELYLEMAPGASIDPFSVMASFSLSSTNGAIDSSFDRVCLSGLPYAPRYEAWGACAVARLDGTITNRAESGIVTVTLAEGFSDSSGNSAAEDQVLPLLK